MRCGGPRENPNGFGTLGKEILAREFLRSRYACGKLSLNTDCLLGKCLYHSFTKTLHVFFFFFVFSRPPLQQAIFIKPLPGCIQPRHVTPYRYVFWHRFKKTLIRVCYLLWVESCTNQDVFTSEVFWKNSSTSWVVLGSVLSASHYFSVFSWKMSCGQLLFTVDTFTVV